MAKRNAKDPRTGLAAHHEAYCQARVNGMSQIQAYSLTIPRKSPKTNKPRSYSTMQTHAHRLDRSPPIRARMDQLMEEKRKIAQEKFEIDAERVLSEIASIAFSDVKSLFDADGNLRNVHDMTPAERACIEAIEIKSVTRDDSAGTTTTVMRVKLWNKNDGLEKLARHLGLYAQDNAQKAASRLADLPRGLRDMILKHLDELASDPQFAEPSAPAGAACITH